MENEAVPEERPELVYTDHMESLSSSALPHARVQEKQEGSGPYTKQLRIEQDFSSYEIARERRTNACVTFQNCKLCVCIWVLLTTAHDKQKMLNESKLIRHA